jgi:hypothetical protein
MDLSKRGSLDKSFQAVEDAAANQKEPEANQFGTKEEYEAALANYMAMQSDLEKET